MTKYIQLVTFRNTSSDKYWLFNLERKKAIYLRGDNRYEILDLGFEVVDTPTKLMAKIIKNVRKGFYPAATNLKNLIADFHPEVLL
jgi:hypothetical protein